MKLLSCEHPKKVLHPYTHEELFVPCGKCAACLNRRASIWQHRIDAENKSHKYSVFFELDYDEKSVPKLFKKDDCFVNFSKSIVIPFEDCKDWSASDYLFISEQKYIKHLSLDDMQKFFKRLRINISRSEALQAQDCHIRYYFCGEYGPTTFRPHYHVILWFDNDALNRFLPDLLHKSWSLGRVRALKPVHDNAGKYIARYVTCTSELPALLRHKRICQFAQSSRRCPIGCLPPYSEEVRRMFFEGTYKRIVVDGKTNVVSRVPIPSYYQSQFFPRVPLYGHFVRRLLYKVYEYPTRFKSYKEFFSNVAAVAITGLSTDWFSFTRHFDLYDFDDGCFVFDSDITSYIRFLYHYTLKKQEIRYGSYLDTDLYPWHAFRFWWSVANRVNSLRHVYGVTLKDYVDQIDKFYVNKDYELLTDQLQFEEEFVKHRPLSLLLSIDPVFVERCKNTDYLTSEQVMILDTFNVSPGVLYRHEYVDTVTGELYGDFLDSGFIDPTKSSSFIGKSHPFDRFVYTGVVTELPTFSLQDYEWDIYNTPDYHLFCANNEFQRVNNTKTKLNRDYMDLLASRGDPRYAWLFNYRANIAHLHPDIRLLII